MEDIIVQARLLTRMNISDIEYQKCLIKNQDNIYRLIDRLNEIEQLYNSVVHKNQELSEENKDLKKKIRNLEMDNNLLYFELQNYHPNPVDNGGPEFSISD